MFGHIKNSQTTKPQVSTLNKPPDAFKFKN